MRKLVGSALLAGVIGGCDQASRPVEPTTPALTGGPRVAAGLLPELQTVVPGDVRLVRSRRPGDRPLYERHREHGSRPDVIPRFPWPGAGGTQDALQQVFDADGIVVVQERVVSQYEHHPGHNHWHIAGVAVYRIKAGSLRGPIVGDTRRKTTFCLIDVAGVVLQRRLDAARQQQPGQIRAGRLVPIRVAKGRTQGLHVLRQPSRPTRLGVFPWRYLGMGGGKLQFMTQ